MLTKEDLGINFFTFEVPEAERITYLLAMKYSMCRYKNANEFLL